MSDELERLERDAHRSRLDHVDPEFGTTDREHRLARGVLAILSERRAMMEVIDAARELRDGDGVSEFPRSDLWGALDKYEALAARIAPNQDGEK